MFKYFRSYLDAKKFIKQSGLLTEPEKKEVWIYPSFETVWAVKIVE